jgi:hypothetical protein
MTSVTRSLRGDRGRGGIVGAVVAVQEHADRDGGGERDPSGDQQGEVQPIGERGVGLGGDRPAQAGGDRDR